MKAGKEKVLKDGSRQVLVTLSPNERLIAVREDTFYKLGYPVEDVVAAHVILDLRAVSWCSLSQDWV